MTMESGADNQQSGDAAVTEAENQQMTAQAQPQIATLAQVSMPAAHATSSAPTVTLVQLPNGQTVQVHGVIQAAQPSVIQSPQVQTVQSSCKDLKRLFSGTQISTIAESEDSQESVDSVTDSQKRREILSRRPSYRKILNDLSSDAPGVPRIEEEKSEEETSAPAITTVTVPTPIYQTSSGQYTASGDVQTYQIRTAPTSTIAPGVVMASSPALPTQPAEEAARKREVRLMKNREAARECRRKKKEYVKCLENRVAVLENQNKTLIEELKALKDLYCHKSD
ncbi:cyclic AMP-responsive element-binding protein 1 isoform X3 [Cricetulus griseus]|uniref:Cyclic AMP-responsive element-binding protein 1 isoform X3 n=3 Tax=Cricetidae TaxID=337677 RepID=A0A9J7FBI0_CRIGR|nr:cyclic AMP-responsive element-binding protein 1 isoform X3 [Cricetulus griseus]XP_021082989.1 cyclic AMP-responsive element-binding protein 1 isoform X4 [Mesocricetus auratus]XP_026641952.1 cyclic AMP-responsive element-binding protein 1 isoform X5 [Microtus ochrogaster]XP_027252897.1 cyclic AMP-responsive element-binding protein 1 isoform X3 [Cricetulus griseus]XP_041487865.1 cyclic AMP-responsive element-binding protein 1 isoform X4 [Microtus oregoni]XP_048315367.1 cyclic AMP-responsive e